MGTKITNPMRAEIIERVLAFRCKRERARVARMEVDLGLAVYQDHYDAAARANMAASPAAWSFIRSVLSARVGDHIVEFRLPVGMRFPDFHTRYSVLKTYEADSGVAAMLALLQAARMALAKLERAAVDDVDHAIVSCVTAERLQACRRDIAPFVVIPPPPRVIRVPSFTFSGVLRSFRPRGLSYLQER